MRQSVLRVAAVCPGVSAAARPPNSHMHKWARAGVALRSSRDDDGAAYFALVRPAQYRRPAQVQLRAHADGVTTASAARSVSAVLLKLRCRYTGGSTECEVCVSVCVPCGVCAFEWRLNTLSINWLY